MNVISLIVAAVVQGIPLLYGATGEIVTEKSGNLNLGIPGIMYVGGISGIIGAFFYENSLHGAPLNPFLGVFIPFMCSIIGSALMGLIYCFLTITLRANQNVTGLALTTFGTGLGSYFAEKLTTLTKTDMTSISLKATGSLFKKSFPAFPEKVSVIGRVLFSYGFLTYFAILIALFAAFFLKKTRPGLHLRAVGENPATADAAGINVSAYKYAATILGSSIAGLGGLHYVMEYLGGEWENGGFGDRGWLAIAIVIFAIWRPNLAVIGSILFGGLYILGVKLTGSIATVFGAGTMEIFKMTPYVVTIIVLIISSIRNRRENQPPASLGLPYFREDR